MGWIEIGLFAAVAWLLSLQKQVNDMRRDVDSRRGAHTEKRDWPEFS